MKSGRRGGALALIVLLCGLTLIAGLANKYRCTGPEFDERGRSAPRYEQRNWSEVCYSDIQFLWLGRGIDRHVFPYVNGGLTADGRLVGGSVEYPVLGGVLIWAGALFADTDAEFLIGSAILLAPFGLAVAWLLGRLTGTRALWWSLGPPLVLYAFHNWDLPAVAAAVGAFSVLFGCPWWSLRTRSSVAAVLLGLGFAVKVYPAIFLLPVALYAATGGPAGAARDASYDIRGAARVLGIGIGTAVLVNLPFAVTGFAGWWASFAFQAQRKVDITTNSLWFWAFRPSSDPENSAFQSAVSIASPVLILASFTLACVLGWRRYRAEGSFPVLAVSAAMLCGFLLLHRVHSPQFALWLLPMFVLLRVRAEWIMAYLLADLAMGIGIFRWFGELAGGVPAGITDGFASQAVVIGVWGRAVLLAALFFVFLQARPAIQARPPVVSGQGR